MNIYLSGKKMPTHMSFLSPNPSPRGSAIQLWRPKLVSVLSHFLMALQRRSNTATPRSGKAFSPKTVITRFVSLRHGLDDEEAIDRWPYLWRPDARWVRELTRIRPCRARLKADLCWIGDASTWRPWGGWLPNDQILMAAEGCTVEQKAILHSRRANICLPNLLSFRRFRFRNLFVFWLVESMLAPVIGGGEDEGELASPGVWATDGGRSTRLSAAVIVISAGEQLPYLGWVPRSLSRPNMWPKSFGWPNSCQGPRSVGKLWLSKLSWDTSCIWGLLWTKLMDSNSLGLRIWDPGGIIRTTIWFVTYGTSESSGVVLKDDSSYFVMAEHGVFNEWTYFYVSLWVLPHLLVLSVYGSGRICNGHSGLRLAQVSLVLMTLQKVFWMCYDMIVINSIEF